MSASSNPGESGGEPGFSGSLIREKYRPISSGVNSSLTCGVQLQPSVRVFERPEDSLQFDDKLEDVAKLSFLEYAVDDESVSVVPCAVVEFIASNEPVVRVLEPDVLDPRVSDLPVLWVDV